MNAPQKQPSFKEAIASEIRAALTAAGDLTTAELLPHCPSAQDTTEISRAIYDLRKLGQVGQSGERQGPPGRGAKAVKVWCWLGELPPPIDETTTPKEPLPMPPTAAPHRLTADELVLLEEALIAPEPPAQLQPAPAPKTWDDPHQVALAALMDEADETILTYADQALAADKHWQALRKLQTMTFAALTAYRS